MAPRVDDRATVSVGCSSPGAVAAAVSLPATVFGDLPSVRAMGTARAGIVVGFDTEFTTADGERVIDSYQFAVPDQPPRAWHLRTLHIYEELFLYLLTRLVRDRVASDYKLIMTGARAVSFHSDMGAAAAGIATILDADPWQLTLTLFDAAAHISTAIITASHELIIELRRPGRELQLPAQADAQASAVQRTSHPARDRR